MLGEKSVIVITMEFIITIRNVHNLFLISPTESEFHQELTSRS